MIILRTPKGWTCPAEIDGKKCEDYWRSHQVPMSDMSRSDAALRFASATTRQPAVALLSNGRYGVMLTAAGAGYSSWRDMDVTRWR